MFWLTLPPPGPAGTAPSPRQRTAFPAVGAQVAAPGAAEVWLVPDLIVIAGPNGAGKSTAAPAILRDFLGVRDFVNADTVALGLSGFSPDTAAVAAGRVVLQRIQGLISEHRDFALESTLSGRSLATSLRIAIQEGYAVHIVYFWLPSAQSSVDRVMQRVRAGGHGVPATTLLRRYGRSVRNFLTLYLPLAHQWEVFENSSSRPLLVARGQGHTVREVRQPALWGRIQEVSLGTGKDDF